MSREVFISGISSRGSLAQQSWSSMQPAHQLKQPATLFSSLRRNRAGQITLFIIIGIILLFSMALIIYIRGQLEKLRLPPEIAIAAEIVPTELQPIQRYVTDCVESVGRAGLERIGMFGGYLAVDPADPDFGLTSTRTFKIDPNNPTEADVVAFLPGLYVPYWYHMKSPNNCQANCQFELRRPQLHREGGRDSIEAQLDRYIDAHLKECIAGFEPFLEAGFTFKELGPVKSTSYVAENDVPVVVEWPIEVKTPAGAVGQMRRYTTSFDVPLKDIYGLASHIAEFFADSGFLGLHTLNIISAFSGIDSAMLPPIAASTLGYGGEASWTKSDVRNKMQQTLASAIPSLEIKGTLNFDVAEIYPDLLAQGLHDAMIVPEAPADQLKRQDFYANFIYLPLWPIYLDFGRGESLRSKPIGPLPFLSALMPIQDYSFLYDLSYPVVVRIEDKAALKGDGYRLLYALEVNIRNNQPMFPEVELITISLNEPTTEFCSDAFRQSGLITVKTTDQTGAPLPDVGIMFSGQDDCQLGKTALVDGEAKLTTAFPVGLGVIVATKPKYATAAMPFGTAVAESAEVALQLFPLKKIRGELLVYNITNFLLEEPRTAVPLRPPGEIAVITLRKIKVVDAEQDVFGAIQIPEDPARPNEFMLAPGRYEVSLSVLYNETVTIPDEERCSGGFLGIGEKCTTMHMDPMPKYSLSNAQFEFEIKADDLYKEGVTKLTFYAPIPRFPQPYEIGYLTHRDNERLMSVLETYNVTNARELYEPRLS